MIQRFVEIAIADGCLPDNFIARLPEQFLARLSACGADQAELCIETFPELVQQLKDLQEFKRKCSSLIEEFLAGEGAEPPAEFGLRLGVLNRPSYHHEFIRRAINLGLDRGDVERDLISSLLTSLRELRVVNEDDFLWGFSHLLGSLPDLSIDCPQAVELVSKFLIRAVTDEVIPPSFLENAARLGLGDSQGLAAAEQARSALENTQVEWTDLRNVWGRPDKTDAVWKAALEIAVKEYFDSHDKAEFCRLMREWTLCTSRAVAVVKQGLRQAMDGDGNDCMAFVELLDYAVRHEELKSSDVLRAMSELDSSLADLQLDVPDAAAMLDTFGGLLRARDLLPAPSPRHKQSGYH